MLSDTELATALDSLPGERITADYMESRITDDRYTVIKTLTLCTITLDNGFQVTGESACVDPRNYNLEVGQKLARDNAFRKLWPFFGFLLAEKRHQNSKPGINPAARAAEDWYFKVADGIPAEPGPPTSGDDNFSFGLAIASMEAGHRVARDGWNGKGMYIRLVTDARASFAVQNPGDIAYRAELLPHIVMFTAQGEYIPWLASQADMLANDWGRVI